MVSKNVDSIPWAIPSPSPKMIDLDTFHIFHCLAALAVGLVDVTRYCSVLTSKDVKYSRAGTWSRESACEESLYYYLRLT